MLGKGTSIGCRQQDTPPIAANQKSSAIRHVPYFFSSCQPNAINRRRLDSRWWKLWCTNTELSHLSANYNNFCNQYSWMMLSVRQGKFQQYHCTAPVSLPTHIGSISCSPLNEIVWAKLPRVILKTPCAALHVRNKIQWLILKSSQLTNPHEEKEGYLYLLHVE